MQTTTDPFLLLEALIAKISGASDLASALGAVIEIICQQYKWSYGEAWQLTPQTGKLTSLATFHASNAIAQDNSQKLPLLRPEKFSEDHTFSLNSGVPGRVWVSQEWEWHPDVSGATQDVFLRKKEATMLGIKAAFGIPVVVEGTTLAVLVFFSDEVIPTDLQLVNIIKVVATPVGRLVQQKKTEQELRDSEGRFCAFMSHAAAMVFMKDPQGKFVYVNEPLEKTFNVEKGELIGKTDNYMHAEDVAKKVRDNDRLVLSTNQPHSIVEVVPTPDGIERYWQVTKFPFTDHSGQRFVGGLAFDITQLKQFEQQLTVEKLEQQRINESLQSATKAAEAANQAKGDFLAMMSHEIRTPMNAMLGMTELLGDTALNAQQRDFIKVIQTGGNTLLTVINDILDFSKIESNKLDLEVGYLDLYECVEQVLTLFSNQAETKGLALTSIIEPVKIPKYFKGDATRLRQILSNLVSNSIKFTRQGEVSIQAKVIPLPPEKNSDLEYEIQFLVKDTGIGIAKEKVSQLFKPFSQVDTSMTRRYGGTGLGLAISKQLIEMMGGSIDIDSTLGKGTTFRFSVQLAAYGESSQEKQAREKIDLSQKTVLIVDSNPTSRKYLALQAQSWDLNVEVATSAETTLTKLFHSKQFDAITISDSVLDMESALLAKQIRTFPNYQTVPLILLQAQKKDSSRFLGSLNDRTKFLARPAKRSHFYNALVQLLLPETTDSQNNSSSSQQPEVAPSNIEKPLRILLAEDILLNQKVALQMLEAYGYQADIAQTGKAAIEALQKQPYDLVLMDVQMPEMDGLEATRKIRTDPRIKQSHIVAMTAHSMQGDRERCLAAGMDGYVRKPIRKRDLAMVLQQCPSSPQSLDVSKTAVLLPDERSEALPTLDTQILEDVDSSPAFLKEVCSTFLEDAPQRISAIQAAISQKDSVALGTTAHTLKSLSGCIGAMHLFQICQSMEVIGKSGCMDTASPLITQAMVEYQKVQLAVQTYKTTLGENKCPISLV